MTFQHSRPDRPAQVDRQYLDQLVQLNIRIPLGLRIRLDEFIQYTNQPDLKKSEEAVDNNWPSSLQAITQQALEDFLATHQIKERRGPKPKPPADFTKVQPRNLKKGGE